MEVRCIKAIDGHEVNDIIEIGDGIAFAHRGDSGALVIKDFGKGDTIIFVVDDAIDTIGDAIRVQAPDSMHQYFSFDLEIPEEPTLPPTTIDCNLSLSISTESLSTYKYFSDEMSFYKYFAKVNSGL